MILAAIRLRSKRGSRSWSCLITGIAGGGREVLRAYLNEGRAMRISSGARPCYNSGGSGKL